ncbi:MAG: hypothetical protein M3R08_12320, partial [Bacteroidota bacterium]|nr:hypothetical protein [Bacteroidota bacterium]
MADLFFRTDDLGTRQLFCLFQEWVALMRINGQCLLDQLPAARLITFLISDQTSDTLQLRILASRAQ